MNKFKYFFQFILIISLFLIFKILGLKISSFLGGKIFQIIGPIFRSKKLIQKNIMRVFPDIDNKNLDLIISSMWNNYGRVFAEYMFIKKFRNESKNILINGKEILEDIKKNNQKVIFISGHFSNFELMAMEIEKTGIDLCAIYRPLNNPFLNIIMENIRKNHICKNQIKKGKSGTRDLLNLFKKNFSTALMIDQRVSEGILSDFFKHKALTTTIPAQMVKKFNTPIVVMSIERIEEINFKIVIKNPIHFDDGKSIQEITDKLNIELEKVINKSPEQWIWSHNRWK